MITANQSMLQMLCDLAGSRQVTIPQHLQNALDNGLIVEDGCWFLKACRGEPKYAVEKFGDRTGLECFVNSIHVDNEVPLDPTALKMQGFAYANALKNLLEPHGIFKIILGFSYYEPDNAPRTLTCVVRFHKVRPNENWLKDDLDGYKMDSLLVLTTEKAPRPTPKTS